MVKTNFLITHRYRLIILRIAEEFSLNLDQMSTSQLINP
jgi:hypothetical protein